MVVPPWYELPPQGYGGIELICAALIDALCVRGHEVTMFGAGTRTGTSARFVSTVTQPQFERLGHGMPDALHAARVDQLLAETQFDVIHDHTLCGPLAAAHRTAPTVVTVHGPADSELGDFYAALGDNIHAVAISEAQRRRRPELPWAATIHNAIDPTGFLPMHSADGPVLWLGRFSTDKGPDLAIQACREAGLPLVLAGKCNEPAEQRCLDEVIRPMLGDDVKLIVNGDRQTTNRLLSEARCLIMPIRWHEPFGMVMIEAFASGTPVVAMRRGGRPAGLRRARPVGLQRRPDGPSLRAGVPPGHRAVAPQPAPHPPPERRPRGTGTPVGSRQRAARGRPRACARGEPPMGRRPLAHSAHDPVEKAGP